MNGLETAWFGAVFDREEDHRLLGENQLENRIPRGEWKAPVECDARFNAQDEAEIETAVNNGSNHIHLIPESGAVPEVADDLGLRSRVLPRSGNGRGSV